MVLRNFNELICMQFIQHVHMLIVSTVAKVYDIFQYTSGLYAFCLYLLTSTNDTTVKLIQDSMF